MSFSKPAHGLGLPALERRSLSCSRILKSIFPNTPERGALKALSVSPGSGYACTARTNRLPNIIVTSPNGNVAACTALIMLDFSPAWLIASACEWLPLKITGTESVCKQNATAALVYSKVSGACNTTKPASEAWRSAMTLLNDDQTSGVVLAESLPKITTGSTLAKIESSGMCASHCCNPGKSLIPAILLPKSKKTVFCLL